MSFDRTTSPARLRARTRAALGQLVGDVLAAPLGALETRLTRNGWISARSGGAGAPAWRLREVLDRDRALVAAAPATTAPTEAPLAAQPDLPTAAQESAPEQPPTGPAVQAPACQAEPEHEEPIRTRTMARLLAAQGYRARALAIYRALLIEAPHDAELHAEAERLRAQPA